MTPEEAALASAVPTPINLTPNAAIERALSSSPSPTVTKTKEKTTPIADALRNEIRRLLEEEYLALDTLVAITKMAEDGRSLLAVRNPVAQHDAKAQGLTRSRTRRRNSRLGACDGYEGWSGPMVRDAERKQAKMIEEALRDSPLAAATQKELVEILEHEPFGLPHLVEIEQLASHAHRILSSSLGLESPEPRLRSRKLVPYAGGGAYYNPGYDGGDDDDCESPFASPETYGATQLRELTALANKAKMDPSQDPERLVAALAVARREGLADVASQLEGKLGVKPKAPTNPYSCSPPGEG
jgi:hypothetical protein